MPAKKKLTQAEIEALGTIVNDQVPDPEVVEIEEKLKLIQERLILHPSPTIYDRLYKIAEYRGVSVEEHCLKVLEESLNELVGVPHIKNASHYGGTATSEKKIMGPSPVPTVTRA